MYGSTSEADYYGSFVRYQRKNYSDVAMGMHNMQFSKAVRGTKKKRKSANKYDAGKVSGSVCIMWER
jgi:hypothetical protein